MIMNASSQASPFERLPVSAREEIERFEDLERKGRAFADSVSHPTWVSRATLEAIGNLVLDDAETLAKSRGAAKIHRAIMSGDPAGCILDAARSSHAGFIVMGSVAWAGSPARSSGASRRK
jgi:nucleotide-binding universal stress UspA family protein